MVAAAISLAASALLATRIERVAERVGLSEALLGVVAALAADSPEIASAVSAIANHQARVGAGVVLGSGVFNLAALVGLGAVAAGRIALHRKVIVLGGLVAAPVALMSLLAVSTSTPAAVTLLVATSSLAVYAAILASARRGLGWFPAPAPARRWLVAAVADEEEEMEGVIRPHPGGRADLIVAIASLAVVVGGSVVMERSAATVGSRLGVPQIVVGSLVLGVVTGIPNAIAATHLARRGRGAAALSTALNSNNFNATIGLLLPAVVVGLGGASAQSSLVAGWNLGLTVIVLVIAYRSKGLDRPVGLAMLGVYAIFMSSVVIVGSS